MKIRYMLLHAFGMGGTIRPSSPRPTPWQPAATTWRSSAPSSAVTVPSSRSTPASRSAPSSTSAAASSRSPSPTGSCGGCAARRCPEGEFAAHWFTAHVEKAVTEYVAALDDGILVTTRPGLNLIAARHGRKSVVRVGQEHMNLRTHKEPVRQDIARHYGRLDLVTVLTRTDMHEYQRLAPGVKTRLMPNSVHIGGRRQSDLVNPRVIAAGPAEGAEGLRPAGPRLRAGPAPRLDPRRARRGLLAPKLLNKVTQADRVRFRGRTEKLWDESSPTPRSTCSAPGSRACPW